MADVVDPVQVASTLSWIGTGLSFIGYWVGVVVWKLTTTIGSILYLLSQPLVFVLQPFVYLGHFLLACLLSPFRFAAKFETLYIYLGIAAIVGLAGGVIVRTAYGWFYKLLRLDAKPATKQPRPRTAKQYREEKQKQKLKDDPDAVLSAHLTSPGGSGGVSSGYLSVSDGGRKGMGGRSLYAQTIMEEGDSDL